MNHQCTLQLANGAEFKGRLIGAPLKSSGEMVFTTGMVGYSEALTDPSYFGQILIFSYPLIGNYGIPPMPEDPMAILPPGFESRNIHVSGVIITTDSPNAYHWNSFQSLDQWLKQNGVPGICDVDTRHLVHLVREEASPLARIIPDYHQGYRKLGVNQPYDLADFDLFDPSKQQLLDRITTPSKRIIGKGKKRIALIDCGVKWNIIRQILALGCEIELIPWDSELSKIDCDGWLISNGPGDPAKAELLISRVRNLLGESRPILGICLGHQILSLAAGAQTTKMRYGHRSHNQPVILCGTRRGFMTSQNHGYVVDPEKLPDTWEPWFVNANDQTIEGIKHKSKPFQSVQFHPEAAGGPRDTSWILGDFMKQMSI